jgi:hypothetical protein
MLQTPFKMEWSSTFPKARKVRKTLDPEAWERMANPGLIRMLATVFIIPGYILALLLIIMALCNWVMTAPPQISPPLIHPPAALVPSAGNKSVAYAGDASHPTLVIQAASINPAP